MDPLWQVSDGTHLTAGPENQAPQRDGLWEGARVGPEAGAGSSLAALFPSETCSPWRQWFRRGWATPAHSLGTIQLGRPQGLGGLWGLPGGGPGGCGSDPPARIRWTQARSVQTGSLLREPGQCPCSAGQGPGNKSTKNRTFFGNRVFAGHLIKAGDEVIVEQDGPKPSGSL